MQKLYLAMLSIVFGCANICADKVDDGATKMPLTGNEYILEFTDLNGNCYAVMSMHNLNSKVLERALTPSKNVYDLRELQRSHPPFRPDKGRLTLGFMAGMALIFWVDMLGDIMGNFL